MLKISKINFLAVEWEYLVIGEWNVYITSAFLKKIIEHRKNKLPNETGGIILGGVDKYYKKIYVTDTILSPADSIEKPTLFIRGIDGVPDELGKLRLITHDFLYYLGEWHSHPNKCSINMSEEDKIQFAELLEEGENRGEPSLMLIMGDKGFNLFIGNNNSF